MFTSRLGVFALFILGFLSCAKENKEVLTASFVPYAQDWSEQTSAKDTNNGSGKSKK
ncbi:MAG: hypothetical protein HC912_10390 [Saprospiraceae bacterium]|nr:hypothetical protein [Saprospiraceae bacterium]